MRMKKNEPSQIRNIAVIGHGKSGKTSLAEAMLFCGKSTDRLCKVDNGESVLDFEQEEKDRKITIMSALHNLAWKKHFINIIDTPGDANFVSDTFNSLQVVDAAILVVDAAATTCKLLIVSETKFASPGVSIIFIKCSFQATL